MKNQMQLIPLNQQHDRFTIILIAGGGERHYTASHWLSRFFSKFDVNICSIELPGHGSNKLDTILDADKYIEKFKVQFTEITKGMEYGLVGFSLGGLMILKGIEQNFIHPRFGIIFGAGVTLDPERRKLISQFTTQEFFDNRNWTPAMKKYHGEGWDNLLATLASVLSGDYSILSNPEKLLSVPLFFLNGDKDQPFPSSINFPLLQYPNMKTYEIKDCHHFEYFFKGWSKVKPFMDNIASQIDVLVKHKITSTN